MEYEQYAFITAVFTDARCLPDQTNTVLSYHALQVLCSSRNAFSLTSYYEDIRQYSAISQHIVL